MYTNSNLRLLLKSHLLILLLARDSIKFFNKIREDFFRKLNDLKAKPLQSQKDLSWWGLIIYLLTWIQVNYKKIIFNSTFLIKIFSGKSRKNLLVLFFVFKRNLMRFFSKLLRYFDLMEERRDKHIISRKMLIHCKSKEKKMLKLFLLNFIYLRLKIFKNQVKSSFIWKVFLR